MPKLVLAFPTRLANCFADFFGHLLRELEPPVRQRDANTLLSITGFKDQSIPSLVWDARPGHTYLRIEEVRLEYDEKVLRVS